MWVLCSPLHFSFTSLSPPSLESPPGSSLSAGLEGGSDLRVWDEIALRCRRLGGEVGVMGRPFVGVFSLVRVEGRLNLCFVHAEAFWRGVGGHGGGGRGGKVSGSGRTGWFGRRSRF